MEIPQCFWCGAKMKVKENFRFGDRFISEIEPPKSYMFGAGTTFMGEYFYGRN